MRRQLEHGCEQLRDANPGLYRDLALYLQVLREVLPAAVEQACFHLATRFHPQRYCELPAGHRLSLHERTAALVQQATSLLTVEQLSQLAAGMAVARQRRQRDWLQHLRGSPTDAVPLAAAGSDAAHPGPPGPEPAGSVHLDLELPLDLGWSALAALGPPGPADPSDAPVPSELMPSELAEDPGDGLADDGEFPVAPDDAPPPWNSPRLPAEPMALLNWLDGYERALVRRLRNLSHGLNKELLRTGLSRSLLPASLLEAALRGQLEPLQAPANLLRVQLPVAGANGRQLESVAVLARPADLELEHPRLRACRSRLQRHRQGIRRMAEQHSRLQRRLQAHEAERLWHQDNPRSRQP